MNEPELKVTGRNLPVSEAFRKRNPELYAKAGGLPSGTVVKPNHDDEPLGTDAGKDPNPRRSIVRLTSYRTRLIDERNLWDKHFIDSIKEAGLIFDDSPKWCKVQVDQKEVLRAEDERTEIEIEWPILDAIDQPTSKP